MSVGYGCDMKLDLFSFSETPPQTNLYLDFDLRECLTKAVLIYLYSEVQHWSHSHYLVLYGLQILSPTMYTHEHTLYGQTYVDT